MAERLFNCVKNVWDLVFIVSRDGLRIPVNTLVVAVKFISVSHEVSTVLGGPVGRAGEFGRKHQDSVSSRCVADSTWSFMVVYVTSSGMIVILHTSRSAKSQIT